MRIGVIGLGAMGSAIATHLLHAGYPVLGYDIVAAKRRAHRRAGGDVATSCRAVAEQSSLVITSLPSAEALVETAGELAASPRRPAIVIETSTLPLDVKERARERLAARRSVLLDCPLSGTAAQARAKDLAVYASGPRAACRTVAPIFDAFARAHYYAGAFGAGSKMKFVANLLVAIHNVAAAEALVLAKQAGLDLALVLKAIGDGAGGSRMLQVRGPMMVAGTYRKAAMTLGLWQKDMRIIGEFARAVGAPTPLFDATVPIYAAALAAGRTGEDTAAVHAVLREEITPPHVRRSPATTSLSSPVSPATPRRSRRAGRETAQDRRR